MHLARRFRARGMNCFITSPSSQQHKEVNFRQVNIPPLPPCPTQRGLNHSVDFTCPSLNALFPVVCKSTERLLGPMFVTFLSSKSCFNVFSCPLLSTIWKFIVFLRGWVLCTYWFKAALINFWPQDREEVNNKMMDTKRSLMTYFLSCLAKVLANIPQCKTTIH